MSEEICVTSAEGSKERGEGARGGGGLQKFWPNDKWET